MVSEQGSRGDVLEQRIRLTIAALLSRLEWATFPHIRDELSLTDGNLAAHLQVLENAGFVRTRRRLIGKRTETRVSLTRTGRSALAREVDKLKGILGDSVWAE
jgi:DNA-binding MarR family transcriptional regulator